MSDDNNEILLLKASLNGDTAAFERIVSRYQGYICAVTYSAVGDVEKSEELAHEAFISAWSSLDQLRDLGKFRGWLGTIARNVVRNWFRAKSKDVISGAASIDSVDESVVASDQTDEQALTSERLVVVEQALKRIPEKYREVIVLFYRQGQSVKEVADFLELSESAVRQRLSRGRQMLKEQAAEMIETTISRTGPGKAFTACVMGSVGALALKGAATAGAAVAAGGSSTAAASGLSVLFGTVTAKVITAVAIAVIAVGAAVVYKNIKSPDPEKNKPVAVNTEQGNETDQNTDNVTVEKSVDENAVSSNRGIGIVDAVKTGSVEAADTLLKPEETALQYIDPNTLTNIHFKMSLFKKDGSVDFSEESWIKKPYCWRTDKDNRTAINNGRLKLEINHRNKTSQLVESSTSKALIPECPHSAMLFDIVAVGRNLITGRDIGYNNRIFGPGNYKVSAPWTVEKTSEGQNKYTVKFLDGKVRRYMYLYVDSLTGLVNQMNMQTDEGDEAGRGYEFIFDYSQIAAEMFSLKTPEGYQEHAKRLSPKFQGWIFDKDAKPVSNAEIYLLGSNRRGVKGTSNADGEFDFYIPVGNWGDDDAMEYPIFVRAFSADHPDQVAWTVIQSPSIDYELKAVIPSPGEILREAKGDKGDAECLGIHNVTLLLEPAATVSGFVFDRVTGKPVANAEVEIDASLRGKTWPLFEKIAGSGKKGAYEVKTDENGFYAFTCLPTFTWPENSKEEAIKGYSSVNRLQNYTFLNIYVSCYGYLRNGGGLDNLTPKDSLTDRQIDFALVPANVTVRGRVTDNLGEPVVGYEVKYCLHNERDAGRRAAEKPVTDENGEYVMAGCAFDKNLSVRVETGYADQKWGDEELTKGRKFVYYGYKNVPVGVLDGKLEYEVDIVLEKPETVAVFDIKDSTGQPKKGVELQMMSRGGIVSHVWAKLLKGVSDKDGKCVISGLPNFEGEDFEVKVVYVLVKKTAEGVEYKDVDEEIPEAEKKDYTPAYTYVEIKDMPDGKDGYYIEMTLPPKGKAFDTRKKVKLFDSEGNEVKRKIR